MRPETAAALALLGANSITDIRMRRILPRTTILAGAAGLLRCVLTEPWLSRGDLLITAALSLLPGSVLLLIHRTTDDRIGSGDGMVVCSLGVWTGIVPAACSVLAALFLVLVYVIVMNLFGHRIKEVPFVPFILAGYVLQSLF